MTHTNLDYDGIGERSPAQLNAILDRLPKHLEIKIGVPGLFGFGVTGGADGERKGVGGAAGNAVPQQDPGRPPKLSEIAAFCNSFGGK